MILKPDYIVDSLQEIDFKELSNNNIKALVFDLDSTIMPSKAGCYDEITKELLKTIAETFTIIVVSNNKNKDYIAKVQAISPFKVVGHGNKPSCKVMKQELELLNIPPKNTAVIGDRPLTDILAGKLLGATTILVDSITKGSESKIVRFVRHIERLTVFHKRK